MLQGRYIISQEYSFSNQAVFDTLQKRFPHLHFGSGHDNSAPHRVFDTEKVSIDAGHAFIGYWHAYISRPNNNGILTFKLQDRLRLSMFLQLAGCFTPACRVCLHMQVWNRHRHRHLWHGPFVARGPLSLLLVSSLDEKPSLSGACQDQSCLACHSVDLLYIMHCFQARKELGIYVRPVEETIVDWALTLFQLGLASPVAKGH